MEKYELLIRVMHAAQSAREKGFDRTALALDVWVKLISRLIDVEIRSKGSVLGDGGSKRLPRRLSTRKS